MVRMAEWYRNARGAGGVPESDAWVEEWLPEWNRKAMVGVLWVVPESDGCRKTRLGVLKRYRKESFGVKDG